MSFHVTDHAVARYIERVKDHLGTEQAALELAALANLAEKVQRPEWWIGVEEGGLFLELTTDVVAVARNRTITTVMAKPVDEAARARRHRERKLRRLAKKARRQGLRGHGNATGGRPEPQTQDWAA